MDTESKGQQPTINALSCLLAFIGFASVGAVVLLTLRLFYVPAMLGVGALLTALLCWAAGVRPRFTWPGADRWLAGGLLVGLLFRLFPSTHYFGGQDQGLYVAMAEMYLRHHALNFIQPLTTFLGPDIVVLGPERPIWGGAEYIPGITLEPANLAFRTIPFYPLHPAWMAVTRWLFGPGFHTWAVVAMSLVGLAAIHELTRLLTNGNVLAARIALFLAALNPALVFFAKFPLSETLAVALGVGMAVELVRGMREPSNRVAGFQFCSSLVLVAALPLARHTFVMMLPVGGILLLAAIVPSWHQPFPRRWWVVAYLLLSAVLIGLDGLFYLEYLRFPPLMAIRDAAIRRIALLFQPGWLALIISVAIGLSMTLWIVRRRDRLWHWVTHRVLLRSDRIADFSFWIVVLMSIPSLIRWYRNPTFLLFKFVHLPSDPLLFRYHASYRLVLLLSPFLIVPLVGMPFSRLVRDPRIRLLSLLLVSVWIFTLSVNYASLYLYFQSRFLVSEVLPAALILASIVLADWLTRSGWLRRLGLSMLALALAYSVTFAGIAFHWPEGEADPEIFERLANLTTSPDLILTDMAGQDLGFGAGVVALAETSTWFNRNAIPLQAPDSSPVTRDTVVARIFSQGKDKAFSRVLLLSSSPPAEIESTLTVTPLDELHTSYRLLSNGEHWRDRWFYQPDTPGLLLPYKRLERPVSEYLYVLHAPGVRSAQSHLPLEIRFAAGGDSALYIAQGWSGQEEWGRWTDAPTAMLKLMLEDVPKQGHLELAVYCHAYANAGSHQRLELKVNGRRIGSIHVGPEEGWITFNLPQDTIAAKAPFLVELSLPDAHSPLSVGAGSDPRVLGLAVRRIVIRQP